MAASYRFECTFLLAGAAVAAAAYCIFSRRKFKGIDMLEDENSALTELNYIDKKFLRESESPISTITWFVGSHQKATAVIQERLGRILASNLWIGGTLVKVNSNPHIRHAASNETADVVARLLLSVDPQESVLHHKMDTAELFQLCKSAGYSLPARNGFNNHFWRVAVVPSSASPKELFALVVSLSHVAGDGHTYYALYNMLISGNPIKSLDAKRVNNAQAEHAATLGTIESRAMTSSGQLWCALKGLLLSLVYGPITGSTRFQAKSHYFLVDPAQIEKLKKHECTSARDDDAVHFLSTNDIVTSWFFKNAGFPIGFMAVNLRGRVKGFRDDLAGNYENVLTYRVPQDVESPSLIRKSLVHLRRAKTQDQELKNSEFTKGVAIATNWSSFMSKRVDLADCRFVLHVPCFDGAMVPATYGVCIIFRATPDKLAVLVVATEKHMNKLLENAYMFAPGVRSSAGMMPFSLSETT